MASAITGKKRDMTQGPEWKALILFALPIMAGQILQHLYNTVDGIVVGNFVSSNALAAVGCCATLASLFVHISNGLSNGCSVVVSQFYGAGRKDDMRKAASTALILLISLGLLMTVIGLVGTTFIMKYILKVEAGEIRDLAIIYFEIYSIGLVFQFAYNIVSAIMRAVGDSQATLYFLLVSTVANIVLDLLFVVAFHMGVAGVAIATVLAQLACVAVSYVYMFKKHPYFRFGKGEWIFDKGMLKLCLKMGIPTCLQQVSVGLGHIFIQRLVNGFGSATMTAYTVGNRLETYIRVPSQGMFNALASFTGQNVGAGKMDRVKRGFATGVALSGGVAAILCVFLYIFAPQLAGLFGVSGEGLAQSVEYMRFFAIFFIIFAIYQPFNGLFHGSGDPMAATISATSNLAIRVVASYVLVYFFNTPYNTIWRSNIIGWSVALIYAVVHYKGGKWKDKALVKQAQKEEKASHA